MLLLAGLVGALVLAAGCLSPDAADDGTSLGPAEVPGEEAPEGNGTDATSPASGEKDEEDREQGAPSIGNVSMDDATRQRLNRTTIAFTWEASLPEGQDTTSTRFDVPEGKGFQANATLSWETDDSLRVWVGSPTTTWLCSTSSGIGPGTAESPAGCGVRALERADPPRWTVEVSRAPGQLQQELGFTVELRLRGLDPGVLPEGPSTIPQAEGSGDVVDPGWPEPDQADVRPGVKIDEGTCTADFVFATPDNASLLVGTASHCVVGAQLGDPINVGSFAVEGTLAYCSWGAQENLVTCPRKAFREDPGDEDDLALVQIPEERRDEVHPATLVWGGPTHLAEPPEPATRLVTYSNSGNRDAYRDVNAADARPGLVVERRQASTVTAFPATVKGDSGGPVLARGGGAVGVFSSLDHGSGGYPTSAVVSNLAPSLTALEERTGRTAELATWPLFDPPEGRIVESAPAAG